ncbi:hypothetical protein Tco_0857920 [Tanacetum coccineum]|uniref:Uncharacterized protein n=1 Tax=Tanacetum coccineum TaxID=301880 RepID=A0ABQ5BBL3_9ASTR
MSTPVHFDSESISQTPEEAPSEIEEYHPLVSRAPLTDEEFEVLEPSDTRITSSHSSASSDSTAPLSYDHPLTQTSPTPTPTRVSFHRRTAHMAVRTQSTLSPGMSARIAEAAALSPSSFHNRYRSSYETPSPSSSLTLPIRKRYRGTSDLVKEIKDESSDSGTEREGLEGEGHSLEDESHSSEDEGPGSEKEDEGAPEGEGSVPSMFEVDPKDGRVYTNILTYVPPAAPVQTPPSPEWSSGSFPVSPSSLAVTSSIASPVTTLIATISIDEDQFLENPLTLLKLSLRLDSLLFKTINEMTNQSPDSEIFCPEERIKELELRMQRRNNFEEELFKNRFPTEKELAYHKELLGEPQPPFSTLEPKTRRSDPWSLKIPCVIGTVYTGHAYIDLQSPLRDLNPEESWAILEDLALYDNESWNDPRDFAKLVKAITLPQDVPSTSNRHLIMLKKSSSTADGNSMAPKSIAAISHDEKEELRKKGIKSPSKLLSLKYLSPASIKELNKNPSSPKCVHFVNSIVILSTDSDTEEEDDSSTNACDLNLGGMVKGKEEVKEKGNKEDEMETDMEVEEVIKEEESEFKTDEEVEEIFEEEEEDEDDENFNSFPTMKELSHHEWLLKNPRPRG